MLVVTQKEDAWITIEPVDGVDSSISLREAFAHGPILVKLVHVGNRRVRLGIEAPGSFKVSRGRSPSRDRAFAADVGIPATMLVSDGKRS